VEPAGGPDDLAIARRLHLRQADPALVLRPEVVVRLSGPTDALLRPGPHTSRTPAQLLALREPRVYSKGRQRAYFDGRFAVRFAVRQTPAYRTPAMVAVLDRRVGRVLYADQLLDLVKLPGFDHASAERFGRSLSGGLARGRAVMERAIREAGARQRRINERSDALIALMLQRAGHLHPHGHALVVLLAIPRGAMGAAICAFELTPTRSGCSSAQLTGEALVLCAGRTDLRRRGAHQAERELRRRTPCTTKSSSVKYSSSPPRSVCPAACYAGQIALAQGSCGTHDRIRRGSSSTTMRTGRFRRPRCRVVARGVHGVSGPHP
jgi:hypothetical protein